MFTTLHLADIMGKSKVHAAKKKKRHNGLFWISLAVLAGLVASYFIFPGFKEGVDEAYNIITSEDKDRINRWVKQFGALGPIVLILAMTAQMFLFVIPNLLLLIIATLCYGPIWGSLIGLGGVFISSSFGYLIGKKLGSGAIDRFVSEKAQERISVFVNLYGAKAVAALRLSSLASDGLGFVAGMLEMEYKKFIIATMSGIFPVVLLIAIFGHNGNIDKGLIWLAAISVAALIVYIFLDRKRRKALLNRK
jgi:uncharacterized membrane protein YdjX (TVP38/TMEM64 family)